MFFEWSYHVKPSYCCISMTVHICIYTFEIFYGDLTQNDMIIHVTHSIWNCLLSMIGPADRRSLLQDRLVLWWKHNMGWVLHLHAAWVCRERRFLSEVGRVRLQENSVQLLIEQTGDVFRYNKFHSKLEIWEDQLLCHSSTSLWLIPNWVLIRVWYIHDCS